MNGGKIHDVGQRDRHIKKKLFNTGPALLKSTKSHINFDLVIQFTVLNNWHSKNKKTRNFYRDTKKSQWNYVTTTHNTIPQRKQKTDQQCCQTAESDFRMVWKLIRFAKKCL